MIRDTDEVLESDNFLQAERTTLVTILEQNDMYISSEVDLFSACLRWAENSIQETESGLSIVETLGPVFPLIRFRTMTSKEFASTVIPSNMLTDSEALRIVCCILNETGDMPAGFCNNANPRVFYGPREMLVVNSYNEHCTCNNRQNANWSTNISCNVAVYCFGVDLVAARYGVSGSYNENVRVVINEGVTEKASGTFNGQVTFGTNFKVKFDRPVAILPNVQYIIQLMYSDKNAHYYNYQMGNNQPNFSSGGVCKIQSNGAHIKGIEFAKKMT
jgi:hypothetical protein